MITRCDQVLITYPYEVVDLESYILVCRSTQMQQQPAFMLSGQYAPQAVGGRGRPQAIQNARHTAYDMRMQAINQHNKVSMPHRWLCHRLFAVVSDWLVASAAEYSIDRR